MVADVPLRQLLAFLITFLLLFDKGCANPQDFGYDGHNGPSQWGKQYNTCVGKHQSPININLLKVKEVNLSSMVMKGFSEKMSGLAVSNNGHTVMLKVENTEPPSISEGPLGSEYIFSQMHFHWGDNDTIGSEDKINSRGFPMELHMVFFKKEYGDPKNALDHSDGLAVLAFFFELDRFRHPGYDVVTAALGNVTEPHTSINLPIGISFLDLLPYDLDHYFTYNGSLTTPPCSEVVTWIDYEQPIRLGHDQIDSFRRLRSDHGRITHNFRPLQPIGDRVVLYNTERNGYFDNSIDSNSQSRREVENNQEKGKNSALCIKGQKWFIFALFYIIYNMLQSFNVCGVF